MERYFTDKAFPVVIDNPEGYVQGGLTKLEYAALTILAGDPECTPYAAVLHAKEMFSRIDELRNMAIQEDDKKVVRR